MPNNENLYDWAESVGLIEDDEYSPNLSYEDTLEFLENLEEDEWQ